MRVTCKLQYWYFMLGSQKFMCTNLALPVLFYSYSWFAMLGIAPFSYCSWGSLMAPLILVFSLFKMWWFQLKNLFLNMLEIIFYLPVSMGNCDPFFVLHFQFISYMILFNLQCTCSNYSCITNINEKDSNIYFIIPHPPLPHALYFTHKRLSCFTVIFCNPQKPKYRYYQN